MMRYLVAGIRSMFGAMLVISLALLISVLGVFDHTFLSDLAPDTVSSSNVFAAEGYTDEQVAAAKAWLSAHGYPPTRAGAAQAYQDYLDGKFDDDPEVRRLMGDDSDDDEIVDEDSGDSGKGKSDDESEYEDGNSSSSGEGSGNNGISGDKNGTGGDSKADEEVNVLNVADIMNSGSAKVAETNKEEFETTLHESASKLIIIPDAELTLSYKAPESERNKNGVPIVLIIIAAVAVLAILIYIIK